MVDAGDASDASALTIPDSPVGNQLAWLLAEMNGQALTDPSSAVPAHFDPTFLAAVPLAQIVALLKSYAARAPFVLVAFDGTPSTCSLVAVVRDAKGAYMRIALDVSSASTGLIVGLFFTPAGDLDPTIDTWAKVETRMKATAPLVDYMAAEVTDGTCGKKLRGLDTNVARPLGSTCASKARSGRSASRARRTKNDRQRSGEQRRPVDRSGRVVGHDASVRRAPEHWQAPRRPLRPSSDSEGAYLLVYGEGAAR